MSTLVNDELDESYKSHLQKITSGWNSKKNYSSNILSGLVPFVKLYAVFSSKSKSLQGLLNQIPSDEKYDIYSNDAVFGSLKKYGSTDKICIEFGKLESQMQNEKGGVGINNLIVNRTTAECFTIKFELSMTITDSSIFNNQPLFNQIMTLNSGFVIVHGWDGYPLEDNIEAPITPVQNTITFNKGHKNNTFWDYNYVKLYRFNFNVTSEGHLMVNLGFVNGDASHLEFSSVRNISNIVLNNIKEPGVNLEKITDSSVIGSIDGFESFFYNIIDLGKMNGQLNRTSTYNPYSGDSGSLNNNNSKNNIPIIEEFNYPLGEGDYPFADEWRRAAERTNPLDDAKPFLYGYTFGYNTNGERTTSPKEPINTIIPTAPIVFNNQNQPVRATTNDQDGYYFLNNLEIDLEGVKIVNSSTEAEFYNTAVNPIYAGEEVRRFGNVSSVEFNAKQIIKFSASTPGLIDSSNIGPGKWPFQGTDSLVPLKPLAITSAQYQLFVDSKKERSYGISLLQRVIDNDSFIKANEDTIFKNVIEDEVRDINEKRKAFFQERINRGTIIFSNVQTANLESTENPEIDATTTTEQTSDINVEEIPSSDLRIKFVSVGRYIYDQLVNNTYVTHSTGVLQGFPNPAGQPDGDYLGDLLSFQHDEFSLPSITVNDNPAVIEYINSKLTEWFRGFIESYKSEWDNTVTLGQSFLPQANALSGELPEGVTAMDLAPYNIILDGLFAEARQTTEQLLDQSFIDDITNWITGSPTIDSAAVASSFASVTVTNDSAEPVGYYLGPVLEAIIEVLNSKSEGGNNIVFKYELIPESLKKEIARIGFNVVSQINGRSRSINISNEIQTTFDLPMDYKSVDNLLMNRNLVNSSANNLLKDILLAVNAGILSAIPPISLEYKPRSDIDGNTYEIYVASKDMRNITSQIENGFAAGQYVLNALEKENKTIDFNFGESNSLVESFNISSKIDPLTFAAFRLPTNFGLTSISLKQLLNKVNSNSNSNIIKDILTDAKRGKGLLFDNIVSEGGDVVQRIENIENFIDDESVENSTEVNNDITSLLLNDNDLFLGLIASVLQTDRGSSFSSDLLVNFLFNMDATIHGMTGLFLFDPIIVNNFVANSGGIYIINSVQENISPSFFTTTLNLKLHTPFDARSGVTSRPNDFVSVSGDVHAPLMLLDEQYPDWVDVSGYLKTYKVDIENGTQYSPRPLFYPPPPDGNPDTGPFYTQAGFRVYPSLASTGQDSGSGVRKGGF